MTCADLVAGDAVFVDANTLTYHFQPHPVWGSACTDLLQRIENQELFGYTSSHVLSEASHRLMTIEANLVFGWQFSGIGNRLRTHPDEVRKLTAFRHAIDEILQGRLQILISSPSVLAAGAALCQHIGLLTNDGLVVALMQSNGLTKLASNDADFDRVPGLTRYAPL